MTESHAANAAGTWNVPQCAFTVEYSARVLDDIRLAVMDAFFSLPRGGAEIGGILIGRFAKERVTISDYVALDCEHAFGPSFTLSPTDEAKLEELLEVARNSGGGVPVGWYHSHTRSEIFLSDADLAIHKRFFPEPWHVALVLKPHTFQPMRCGFFFREADGTIQGASSYREFSLDALPMRPIPSGGVPLATDTVNPSGNDPDGAGKVIDIAASRPNVSSVIDKPPIPVEPVRVPDREPVEPPKFAEPHPPRSWRWLKVLLAAAVGIAIGAAAFQSRQLWWNKMIGLFTPGGASTFAPLGLSTIDIDGQLQIRWDRFSPSIRQAVKAQLSITDVSPVPREIELDPVRLQSGNFTFVREGEVVTVVLTVDEPNGQQTHEVSTFLGKLPQPKVPTENSELRAQRDALAQESGRLRQELAGEVEQNRKLQKALEDARLQLQRQVRKRLGNQIPAKLP
jgi:proteasome lid subunit RPN8/RPN11